MYKNHIARRLEKRLPQEMKDFLKTLDIDFSIDNYISGSMGWQVDFTALGESYSFIYDRGYCHLNSTNLDLELTGSPEELGKLMKGQLR